MFLTDKRRPESDLEPTPQSWLLLLEHAKPDHYP